MDTQKHTPGPWEFEMIATREGETETGVITSGRAATDYCKANPRIAITDHVENGEGKANAHLIASAPDMLAALKQFVRYAENGKHPYLTCYLNTIAGKKMRDAIAKAEGK